MQMNLATIEVHRLHYHSPPKLNVLSAKLSREIVIRNENPQLRSGFCWSLKSNVRLRHVVRVSSIGEAGIRGNEEEDFTSEGEAYKKTLRLVECSMFAALGGLAYILSSSLAIEVCVCVCGE